MKWRALSPRRLTGRPRAALITFGVVVVAGGGLVAVSGGDRAVAIRYAAVTRGDVATTVGAAGTVQSAKIREVGFGTSGTVTKVYVTPGQKVAAGRLLAALDDTEARENVTAATAALAAAQEAVDTAGSGSPGSACPAAGATGAGGGTGTGSTGTGGTGTGSTGTGSTGTGSTGTGSSGTGGAGPGGAGSGTAGAASGGATAAAADQAAESPSPTPSTTPSTTPTPTPTPSARPTPSHSVRPSGPPGMGGGQAPRNGRGGSCGRTARQTGSAPAGQGQQERATTKAEAEAQVVQAEVTLAQARRALAGTKIKAPISGTILSIAGTTGTQVSGPGSSGFAAIGDLTELQVHAMFSQTDVARLRIGQQAAISIDGTTFDGAVTRIDPAATVTGDLPQYGVMIAFDEVPGSVLLGQTATTQVTIEQADGAIVVPSSAIRTGPGGVSTVQVRDGVSTLTRTVGTGVRGDQYTEITSGLTLTEQVALP